MARKETQPTTEIGRQLEKERNNRGLTRPEWYAELEITKPTYIAWLTRQGRHRVHQHSPDRRGHGRYH